jgi:hypothetical protein
VTRWKLTRRKPVAKSAHRTHRQRVGVERSALVVTSLVSPHIQYEGVAQSMACRLRRGGCGTVPRQHRLFRGVTSELRAVHSTGEVAERLLMKRRGVLDRFVGDNGGTVRDTCPALAAPNVAPRSTLPHVSGAS